MGTRHSHDGRRFGIGADAPDTTPRYSIGEVSDMTGISAFTLRYYDKCGFFPNLYRDKNKVRSFSDNDIAMLNVVDALRKSGLSIEGIQYYMRLLLKGATGNKERLMIIQRQETVLEYQRDEIDESLEVLENERMRLDRLENPPPLSDND